MFGIGAPELIIIGIIALLIFGPSKLPELGKTIGKGLKEFRNASSNLKDQINPLSDDNTEKERIKLEENNLIEDKETGKKKIKTRTTTAKKHTKPLKSKASVKTTSKRSSPKPKN
ncbi:MAG: TatA/E family twin arginine-targeting protein translocase [bacterium]|jgi:TatA/E family protein of Tat protein translocase